MGRVRTFRAGKEVPLGADSCTGLLRATAVERAFDHVSDLALYSADQIAASTHWIVHTPIDISAEVLAESAGVDALESTGILANTFIYQTELGKTADAVIAQFDSSEFIDYYYPLLSIDYAQRSLPNDPYILNQWHLRNVGQQVNTSNPFPVYGSWGADACVEPVWDLASGDGIIIGIVDDGFQYTHPNSAASYSEGGASVLVVAPSGGDGGGIVTTDLVGEDGYNQTGYLEDQNGGERNYFEDIDYTSTFGGTSAAAPIVSGIVALMLEVNPSLTYRDIEHILVRSAGQIDPSDPAWQANWDPIFFDPWVDAKGHPWLNDTIPPYDPNTRVPWPLFTSI